VAARPRIEVGGVSWWLGRGVDREAASGLLAAALEALHSGAAPNLKSGRRKQLYPLDLGGGGSPDHFLKVNDYRGGASLRRAVRGSKARHELEMAEQVAARGIPTPAPLAAGEQRSRGLLRTCYLLMPILPGVVDLRRLWWEEEQPPGARHALAVAFGELSRQVHDAGVFQDDFAPNNFLVQRGPSPRLFMIDFERAELRPESDEAARCFMLAKIDREFAGAAVGDRMRFLCAYSRGDRAEARRWWREVEDFAPRLAHRDFTRLKRNATRPGRRFRRMSHDAWRGYARIDSDEAALVEALPKTRDSGVPVRVDAAGDLWRVHYSGLRRSEARRIWVTANFLWARGGLCPRPLGAWCRGDRAVLLLERRDGVQPLDRCSDRSKGLAAVRILLDRILAVAEIREPPPPEGFLVGTREGSALRASLAAPHGVQVTGTASGERRARRAELERSLRGQLIGGD
jgi:tRNA A-37 threonylcarbamoyl transferase component Bud32